MWATAQRTGPVQRRGRYVPESVKHPARMLPAIAAHAIARLHPARRSGARPDVRDRHHPRRGRPRRPRRHRRGVRVPLVRHRRRQHRPRPHPGRHRPGRRWSAATPPASPSLLPAALAGQVALVVTSPPYGPTVHGLVRPGAGRGRTSPTTPTTTAPTRATSPTATCPAWPTGSPRSCAGCATLLRPGGTVVVTARPWRKNGELVDLPSAVIAAGVARRPGPDRAVRRAARRRPRRAARRPAVVLPAPAGPQGPRRRHADAPDRARGRPRLRRATRTSASSGEPRWSQTGPDAPGLSLPRVESAGGVA